MKKLHTALTSACLLLACATAQAQSHTDKETQADIQRHRAMAAAHEAAAWRRLPRRKPRQRRAPRRC